MCWCQQTERACDDCEHLHRLAWLDGLSKNRLPIAENSWFYSGDQLEYSDDEEYLQKKPVPRQKKLTKNMASNRFAVLASLGENATEMKPTTAKTTSSKKKKY